MIDLPVLIGSSVTLRRPRSEDVLDRLALGQAPEIVRMFGADPAAVHPLTEVATREWIDRLGQHPHAWVIEHDGKFLGEIRLDAVDDNDRRARLAVGLYDPAKLGLGLGREAIRLVLGHAFHGLKLHRVGLRVVEYNVRAIRCYLACGFVEEGREREAAFISGEWHDDVIMGLLAREFERPA